MGKFIQKQVTDKGLKESGKPVGDMALRKIITMLVLFSITFVTPYEGMAQTRKNYASKQKQTTAQKESSPVIEEKYAAIVVDAESGAIISQKNAGRVLHPASLTKVMTLLLLFEAMDSGKIRRGDKIIISKRAAAQSPSKLGLTAGSTIRVEDAILAVVTKSANDISLAIAEHVAGSESRFAAKMTRRARDIGMTKTNFVNASGLHNSRQVSTARDMAILARYVIVRYPDYYRYFSTRQFTYRGKTHNNHNKLMASFPGMDGFKTGYINASGFNLIASAKRNGNRIIGVVFGGRSAKSRNDHMATLLNAGFPKAAELRYAREREIKEQQMATTSAPTPTPPPVQPSVPTPDDRAEIAALNAQESVNRGDYTEVTGEGDTDVINARRIETGLLASAVYKGDHPKIAAEKSTGTSQNLVTQILEKAGETPPIQPALTTTPAPTVDLWAVQIGAFKSRVMSDDALRAAKKALPAHLNHASPMVVPMQAGDGSIVFRARLGSLSKDEALAACQYFRDCLPVSPN